MIFGMLVNFWRSFAAKFPCGYNVRTLEARIVAARKL